MGNQNYTGVLEDSAVAAIADLAQEAVDPKTIDVSIESEADGSGMSATILFVPKGYEAKSIKPFVDEYRKAPERRRGTATLEDLESFIAHVNRFKDEGSVVFAKKDPPSLLAVLDYHPAGASSEPRFGRHRSAYAFPLSDEWKTWNDRNGSAKLMDQANFAEFIETRIIDVRAPDGVGDATKARLESIGARAAAPFELLNLSRGLAIRAELKVQNAVNLSTGETQLEFVTTHQDAGGKTLDVPGAFVITIPVFRFGQPYELVVRLRYRLRGGEIGWFYELLGQDAVFDDAFVGACQQTKEQTGLPLYGGTPET